MHRAGIQGVHSTPEFFKQMLISKIEILAAKWESEGKGVVIDHRTGSKITSLEWADNIFTIAKEEKEAQEAKQGSHECVV